MNTYSQLTSSINELQALGKSVKVTQLKSQAKTTRKSMWGVSSKSKGSTKVS